MKIARFVLTAIILIALSLFLSITLVMAQVIPSRPNSMNEFSGKVITTAKTQRRLTQSLPRFSLRRWGERPQMRTALSARDLNLMADPALALVSDPTIITFSDFVTQPSADTIAVLNTPLTFFPTVGDSYVALSTGATMSIPLPDTFASTSWGGPNVRGDSDFDVTIWRIGLNVPSNVNCLQLDFQFLSEEYPGFVGSAFNDAFIGELDDSTWTTSGSKISAPNNFIFDAHDNPITINSVVGLSEANGEGTAFDGGQAGGATDLLIARTPITPGPHTLYLSIFDQGDRAYDSVVLLDNLNLFNAPGGDCQKGVVEIPKIYLPFIAKNFPAPDLVVDSLTANNDRVTVVIKNIGSAPAVDPFWVDVYIDPDPAPSGVNQHWWQLADQGLVWGVTKPMAVGETLSLTIGDPYYSTFHSGFTGSLASGVSIWAQVDSVNLNNTTYGGVLELHEISGGAYNNLFSVELTGTIEVVNASLTGNSGQPPAPNSGLPPRR